MRFAERFFDADNPSWLKRAVVGFFLFLTAFRIWNAWHFNPYWGYDGGGHLDYIFSLADGHFPSIKTNYIAWHEPLYYLLMAVVAKIHRGLHTLGLVQVVLSIAVAMLSWKVTEKITKSPWARAMSVAVWNLLPAVTMASAFVTNELLNYFFILLIVYLALCHSREGRNPSEGKWIPDQVGNDVLLGIICGLALLTKISAVIAIAALVLSEGYQQLTKNGDSPFRGLKGLSLKGLKGTDLRKIVLVLAISSLLYVPWLFYRTRNILPSLSINNTAYMSPAPLALDSRIKFFLKFDTDILIFPYWYSGGRGFWSMLYADTFWDYYAMMKNPDALAKLPADEKISTDHNGGIIPRSVLPRTRSLPYLAIPLALMMLLGLYQVIKSPFNLLTLLSLLSLLSLVYFSYRYPFYDRGIVKSIFIAPAFLPILAAGFTSVEKRIKQAWGKPVVSALIFVYVATLLSTMTMSAQGY